VKIALTKKNPDENSRLLFNLKTKCSNILLCHVQKMHSTISSVNLVSALRHLYQTVYFHSTILCSHTDNFRF